MAVKQIAVFGYNSMSYELATNLDTKEHEVIIVDSDENRVALAVENGFDAAVVDYRSDENLKNIGIGRTIDLLFCFLEDGSENVFLTISARALDQDLEIISVVENPESAEKLLAAGADKIIDPYEICGRKIYQLVKKPEITRILDQTVFGRDDLNMAEVEIPAGSYLENKLVSELKLNIQFNLILVGVVDKELGEDLYFSLGEIDHKLDASDILVVLGPSRDIRAFKKQVEKGYDNI